MDTKSNPAQGTEQLEPAEAAICDGSFYLIECPYCAGPETD